MTKAWLSVKDNQWILFAWWSEWFEYGFISMYEFQDTLCGIKYKNKFVSMKQHQYSNILLHNCWMMLIWHVLIMKVQMDLVIFLLSNDSSRSMGLNRRVTNDYHRAMLDQITDRLSGILLLLTNQNSILMLTWIDNSFWLCLLLSLGKNVHDERINRIE